MLTIPQKAQILRRAGIAVPAQPQMVGQMEGSGSAKTSLHPQTWEEQVEVLFVRHAIERAKQSLQQGEAARQLGVEPASLDGARAPGS
jgi:hypothetical protein